MQSGVARKELESVKKVARWSVVLGIKHLPCRDSPEHAARKQIMFQYVIGISVRYSLKAAGKAV